MTFLYYIALPCMTGEDVAIYCLLRSHFHATLPCIPI